ncbi:MAG: hypothetical protein EA369_08645 [Bradymonadales bacterium]|nr:MAG: hypothetical protein EA369_08645 [Bradymonadales bacterium]
MGALKRLVEEAAIQGISGGFTRTKRLIKIESTRRYVVAVQSLRVASLSILSAQLFLFLAALSLLALLASVLFLLPLGYETRLWVALGGSLLIFLASMVAFSFVNSEKRWLEFSKANELIEGIYRRP